MTIRLGRWITVRILPVPVDACPAECYRLAILPKDSTFAVLVEIRILFLGGCVCALPSES